MNTTKEIMQKVSLEELTEESNLLCFTFMLTHMQSLNLLKNAQLMETDTFMTLKLLCCYLEFVFVIMWMPQPIYKG